MKKPLPLLPDISIIARGAGIVLAGGFLGAGLRFLFHIWVARVLGSELFGIFLLGLGITRIFQIISEFGLTEGVVRFVALFTGEDRSRHAKGVVYSAIGVGLLNGMVISGLLVVFSSHIAVGIFHEARLSGVLKIFALLIAFSVLTSMSVSVSQGLKNMVPKVMIQDIFEPGWRLFLGMIIIILGGSLSGITLAYCLPALFSIPLALFYLKRDFPSITVWSDRPVMAPKKLIGFSFPLMIVRFFSHTMLWLDTLLLGIFRSSGQVGIYGAAQRTVLMGTIIRNALNSIFSPFISDLYNRKKYRELERYYKVVSKWMFTLNLPFFLFVILFSREILWVFGTQYQQGGWALVVLSVAWIVYSSGGSMGEMITMSGRSKLQFANRSSMLVFNITLNLILIPRYGFRGAAVATAFVMIAYTLVQLVEIRLIFGIHPFRMDYLKPFSAALVAGLSVYLAKKFLAGLFSGSVPVIFILIGGGALYGGIFLFSLLIMGMDDHEKIIWGKVKQKLRIK